MDPGAQQVGIGGTLFLCALYLLLKFSPWRRDGRRAPLSGEMEKGDWENFMRQNSQQAASPILAAIKELKEEVKQLREAVESYRRGE